MPPAGPLLRRLPHPPLRRHGTSHRYAAQQASEPARPPAARSGGLITCHLGNGSITAVNHGKSIDTTMASTPLEEPHDGHALQLIDPAILTYIMRRGASPSTRWMPCFEPRSGVLGVSGLSADMRDVLAAADANGEQARLAIDMYVYRVQKAIGGFYAAMTRTDAVVMTAGVTRTPPSCARTFIFDGLAHMGMILDREAQPRGGTDRREPHHLHRRQPHQDLRRSPPTRKCASPRNRQLGRPAGSKALLVGGQQLRRSVARRHFDECRNAARRRRCLGLPSVMWDNFLSKEIPGHKRTYLLYSFTP